MSKRTLFIEEKQGYLITQLERYYKNLETLTGLKFEGLYTTSLDCNSKYTLDVILTATDNSSYISYDLGLTLYKKENGVAQHSLRLALDNPKMFRGVVYHGYSTPCFRGKLQTNQTVQFMCDYLELADSRKLVAKGIHKEDLLSAYFDGAVPLTDFINRVLTKVKHPHSNVAGLN